MVCQLEHLVVHCTTLWQRRLRQPLALPCRIFWAASIHHVSPLSSSPPHALDVRLVGGMFDTPPTIHSPSTDKVDNPATMCTASTDSKGCSTLPSCSPGDIPFITTPGLFLNALGLEQMASGYLPSRVSHLVDDTTPYVNYTQAAS